MTEDNRADLASLLSILDLEQLGETTFRGTNLQNGWRRVYGGQVVAQALVAAQRTVVGRPVHSLHCYFIRPGDPKVPIVYRVELTRDGRSFTTRRVDALQNDVPIFSMLSSFAADDVGLEHQAPMPEAPRPDELPSIEAMERQYQAELPQQYRRYIARAMPVEIRLVDLTRFLTHDPQEAIQRVWMRVSGKMPDQPVLHQAVLAFASDYTLIDTALIGHGRLLFDPELQIASIDHAIWFHRQSRMDEWVLYAQDSPSAHSSRGMCMGRIFTGDGTLLATVAQEGLFRRKRAQ